jgi:hypothetical protein
MSVIFNHLEVENIFKSALTNALSYMTNKYNLQMDFMPSEYSNAHKSLCEDYYEGSFSFEDVIMKMLDMGYSFGIYDRESEETYTIRLHHVYQRVQNAPLSSLVAFACGKEETLTAEAVLQQVFFNEQKLG